MSWFSRCSWCGGPINGGNCRHCTNVSFGDEFVRNPDPISNDETPDFSYPPSQPQTSSLDQLSCFHCGDPLEDGVHCRMVVHVRGKFNGMSIETNKKKELRQLDQVANLSTYTTEPSRRFNSFYDDDDYEERTIPLNKIVSQIPPSIAINPDKVIKSSVEDLVPIPSESEDTSGSDSECDLPSCNDFSPINVSEGESVTFSNPLFDSNDDFTSSDDESLSDEDVPEDNVKIYPNPLFEFDDEYISSDVNPLFNEVLENIESEDSYVSKLDGPDLLATPLSAFNEDECFDPGGDIDEIDAFLDIDVSTDIEDDYYDSEGDIIYLENFLIKDTIPNLPPEVFLDRDPRSLKDESDKDDLKNIVKVFDPGIPKKFFSPT
ncbi:hypothetical protein Tco_0030826 [Tanacetum coccineum]